MSRLETDVRHHLEPMLLGKSVTLDTVQQSLLATWAYKTMAMAQFANSNIPPFPRRHLEHLYTFLEPPKNMNIWSAFWGGTVTHTLPMHDYGFYDSRVIDKDHPPEAVNIPYRYSATVRIDKVAFQLVGIDDDNAVNISPGFDRGFWGDSIVTVWPTHIDSILWPPRFPVTVDGWMKFIQRFVGMLESNASSHGRP